MDIKRLLSRKVLLAALLLYLFQVVAFVGNQINQTGLGDFRQQSRQYYQLVEELKKLPAAESLVKAEELLAEDRSLVTLALVEKLIYLTQYEDSIERILDNAEHAKEFSIFQNQNSYAYVNTVKTAQDFERMRGVSLLLDQDRATQKVLGFSGLPFFVAAFILYVLYEILRERDNGMWAVTHVLKNGRCRLAAGRGLGLAVITAAFYLLCLLTNLLAGCLLYGVDDFGGYIQTIQAYAKYPLPVSKLVYLGLFAAKSCFALVAVVMLCYLIFTVLRSRNLAVVLLLTGFAGEWQLMRRIPVYSNLKLLRYVNLMQIFDSTGLDQEYQNLNVFGKAVSAPLVLFLAEALLLVACFGLTVWIYGRQYPGKTAWFDQWLTPVRQAVQKLLERLPFGCKEAYKILVSKHGFLFILFGAAACLLIYEKTLVTFPELQQKMDAAYDSYGGSDWSVFNSYVAGLEKEYAQKSAQAEEMSAQIRAGLLEPEKVTEVSMLQNQAASILIYLKEYHEKQALCQRLQTEKGIEIYAMSDRGYCEIMGPNSTLRELVIGIVLLALLVLFASQTFGFESRAHMKPLLKSAGRGIAWLWRRKLLCIFLIAGGLLTVFYGTDYGLLLHRYRTPYLNAPIQSLTFYAEQTARISIVQLLALQAIFKVVLPLCAAASALLISSSRKVSNQMYVLVLIVMYAVSYVLILLYAPVWLLFTAVLMGTVFTGACVMGSYKKWCV